MAMSEVLGADFLAECEALDALVSTLNDADFERPTVFYGWTVRDEIMHLYFLDLVATASIEDEERLISWIAEIRAHQAKGFEISHYMRQTYGKLDREALLTQWRKAYRHLAALFAAGDAERRIKWFGPDMSVRAMANARQMEVWAHGQDVFDLFGVVRTEHDRVRGICDLGVRTYGWTFRNRKLDPPAPAPRVTLTGPSGAVWRWNESSDNGAVEGPAVDFAAVVTQRRHVDDTSLEVTGEAARAWMEMAQCFAGPPSDGPAPGARVVDPAATAETIPHVISLGAARGDALALVDGALQVSYREFNDLMMRAAAFYVRAGLQKGDRVAIWAQNGLDWIVACLGAQAAGAVVVPINTRFKGVEAAYVLNKSRARFLVVVEKFLGVSYPDMLACHELPQLAKTFLLDSSETASGAWARGLDEAAQDAGAMAEARARLNALQGDAVSDIMFTSGTTGAPKGVMTNHRQNVEVYRAWGRAIGLRASDRYALIWPFFHCSGYKSGWLATFIVGATLYPQIALDAPALMDLVAKARISVLPGPPTLFQTLLAAPGGRDGVFSSLRLAVTGASMVPPSLIESMRNDLGIRSVFGGYGLTESCGTVTMTDENDSAEIVVTSTGKAIPGVEMRTMDTNGALLGPDQEGEIVVRGYNVMLGYLDDPEATREAIDKDGWLHTGDTGTIDERGYLRISGRSKDIYIVGGFNCYPAEIENMIQAHPAVTEVAVVGVPDERMGEVGKAFIVRKPGASISESEIIEWCRNTMANYKAPRKVAFVDALPRNATGKVQKFLLPQD
jgi:uncharacterized protein (TIGR03084 family)